MTWPTCFVCLQKKHVTSFSVKSFNNVTNMIAFRRSNNYKYGDIELTKNCFDRMGYHIKCYRKVMVLQDAYRKKFEIFKTKNQLSTSPDTAYDQSNSSNQLNMDPEEYVLDPADVPMEGITPKIEILNEPADLQIELLNESAKLKTKKQPCIFCSKLKLRIGSRYELTTNSRRSYSYTDKLKQLAILNNDENLLNKIGREISFPYHKFCKLKYERQSNSKSEKAADTAWKTLRDIHKKAFESIELFLFEEIIDKGNVFYFMDFYNNYISLLLDIASETSLSGDDTFETYMPHHLRDKILTKYGDVIEIKVVGNVSSKSIIYKSVTPIDVLLKTNVDAISSTLQLQNYAYDIRSAVKKMETNRIVKVEPEQNMESASAIPQKLHTLISALIKGPNLRRVQSTDDDIVINCVCEDIICAITKNHNEMRLRKNAEVISLDSASSDSE